jgi:hypothetical protein
MKKAFGTVLALAALAMAIDPAPVHPKRVQALAPLTPDTPTFPAGPFAEGAVYPTTYPADNLAGLPNRGSWLGSDAFQGEYRTGWLRPAPKFLLLVAGFPALPPNRLEIELRQADGSIRLLPFSARDPSATWREWEVTTPPEVEAIRIHAVDGSSRARGWLAFSAPFAIRGLSPRDFWPFLQLAATAALAAALVYGPGLGWLLARPRSYGAWALAVLPGPLLLAALGALCWGLGPWIAPATTARIGVGLLLAALAAQFARPSDPARRRTREAMALVGIGILLAGFAVAKANLSLGPPDELYGHTISRTLSVGGRSDSRISYHVVQVVAQHDAPFSAAAERYFSPWSFASRGPLAGLAAAPIVLAVGSEVSASMPDQAWSPFDRQGFAAYRIVLIFLASLAAWAVFGLTAELAGPPAGRVAAAVVLLSPFYVHELFFTWPKLVAAACLPAAFVLVRRRRSVGGGLVVGVGYLFHPGALLAAPFLMLWAIAGRGSWFERLGRAAGFGLGTLLLVAPWMALGSAQHHAGWGQGGFFHYFATADEADPVGWSWWISRWDNFACTFLPFYLVLVHPTHQAINVIGGQSDGWVHFDFLYWDTLPFGLGLPAFAVLLRPTVAAVRRTPAVAFAAVFGPAALLMGYWGGDITGLMRECGHALFLSFIVLAVWTLYQPGGGWRRRAAALLVSPLFLAVRAAEVAWMGFGTSLRHQTNLLDGYYGWNDVLSLAVAAVCLAGGTAGLAWFCRSATAPESEPDRNPLRN